MKLYIIQTKVTRMVVTVTNDLKKAQAMLVSNIAINRAYVGPGLCWESSKDFKTSMRKYKDVASFLDMWKGKCGLEILTHDVELTTIEDPEKLQGAMDEIEALVTMYASPKCFQIVAAAVHGGKV